MVILKAQLLVHSKFLPSLEPCRWLAVDIMIVLIWLTDGTFSTENTPEGANVFLAQMPLPCLASV